MIRSAFILLGVLAGICCFGQAPTAQFDKANGLYQAKDFQAAVTEYQAIIKSGYASAELHYNLANAHYELGQIGPAILHYEKALKHSKGDKNIKTNLGIAQAEIDNAILEVPDFLPVRIWRAFAGLFSSTVWMVLQFIFGLILLYGVYLWRLKGDVSGKLKGFTMFLVTLGLIILSYFAGRKAYLMETVQDAGIVMTSSALKATPSESAEDLENLSPGVKVKVTDQVDDWYQVLLLNKVQGWVKRVEVELI